MKIEIDELNLDNMFCTHGYLVRYKKHWWSRWKHLYDREPPYLPEIFADKEDALFAIRTRLNKNYQE